MSAHQTLSSFAAAVRFLHTAPRYASMSRLPFRFFKMLCTVLDPTSGLPISAGRQTIWISSGRPMRNAFNPFPADQGIAVPREQDRCFEDGSLQEVLARSASTGWYGASVVGYGGEDGKVRVQVFAERHDRRDVAAAVTVVGCRPDGDYVLVLEMVLGNVSMK